MLTIDKIKERFHSDLVIDRHGNICGDVHGVGGHNVLRFLHYTVIDGKPLDQVEKELLDAGYSPLEVGAVISEVRVFIKDVLGITAEELATEHTSTVGLTHKLMHKYIDALKVSYVEALKKTITLDGVSYDADEKALLSMTTRLASTAAVTYWVTANNDVNREWSTGSLSILYEAIIDRNIKLFDKLTEQKELLLKYAEEPNLLELQRYVVPEF